MTAIQGIPNFPNGWMISCKAYTARPTVITILVTWVKKRWETDCSCWGPSKQINKQEWLGELGTIRFPAHAELPGTSGKVVPGEHTAPCPACDNLCFKELASNTLFAWEHVGTANCCWWAAPACRASVTPCSCKCSPCTLVLPFPCTFPCSSGDSGSQRGLQCSPTELRLKVPQKTLQNMQYCAKLQWECRCLLTAHGKAFVPQRLSMEPIKTKTTTLGYATSIIFLFHFFSVLYKWSCFILSLIQSPEKLMKIFPIAFQRLRTRPLMRMNTCFSYCIYSH